MKLHRVVGFAVGPISTAIIGLVTVPVLAWAFAPADIGRLNIFQVSVSFGLLLTVLGLDQAYAREYHESADHPRLLRACFTPGFLFLLLAGLVTVPFAPKLSLVLYGVPDGRFYLITLIAFLVSYISRFLSIILRMQERGWAYSASQSLPKLISLILIVTVVLLRINPSFHMLQWIIVSTLIMVMLIYGWSTRREWLQALRVRVRLNEVRPLLVYGFPLAFSGLAYWGLTATSTFALRSWSTLDELAIYSITNSFAGAAVIFQSIFSTVWAPTVYKWAAQGINMKRVDDVARHALLIACLIFVGVGLFSWVVDYFLPPHYRVVKYLLACAVAPSLLYTLSEVTTIGISISRRTGWTIWITLAALLTNVLLSWWLVPRHGAAGAIMSNALAFFVFFVLRTETSAALWRKFPRTRLYLFLGLMVTLATTIVTIKNQLSPSYPLVWLIPLAVVVSASWIELIGILRFLKKILFRVAT